MGRRMSVFADAVEGEGVVVVVVMVAEAVECG